MELFSFSVSDCHLATSDESHMQLGCNIDRALPRPRTPSLPRPLPDLLPLLDLCKRAMRTCLTLQFNISKASKLRFSKRAMRICLTLQFNISKASKLRFSNSIKNKNTANAEASKPLKDSFGQNAQCYSTVARLTLHSFL
ncbi:hypothetical protein AKJ16_DCAP18353 [Drosera capensis]